MVVLGHPIFQRWVQMGQSILQCWRHAGLHHGHFLCLLLVTSIPGPRVEVIHRMIVVVLLVVVLVVKNVVSYVVVVVVVVVVVGVVVIGMGMG